MMTKRDLAQKIAEGLDKIERAMQSGKITPLQRHQAITALYNQGQQESTLADGAYAQVWQAGCRAHQLRTFGLCGKSEF